MKKTVSLLICSFCIFALASCGGVNTPTDADIARMMVVDDPHHGEFCSEDAATVREFGPGTPYGPIMTNGVVDPLFSRGGYLFGPTDKPKMKVYAIAVDFPDAEGDIQVTHGRHRNVVKLDDHGGTVFDFSDPLIHFDFVFGGSDALKKNARFEWLGSAANEFKGVERIFEEQSMGRLDVEVELLNERYAAATGWYDDNERSPWFRLDEPIFGYSTAGPADCEDYAQFTRLFQAAVDAADRKLREAGLDDGVTGRGANFEDIGFIYVITPFNTFGYRLGFQGGGGIMAAYSVNEQVLMVRDSEYRHAPGATTPGGRMIGSGAFGMKGPFSLSGNAPLGNAINIQLHEISHGLGFIDDYAYGFMGGPDDKFLVTNIGESPHSGVNRWGTMETYGETPDPPVWRKFRQGWIRDEEIAVILPGGEPQTIYLRASGSYDGDRGDYVDDPSILTRMILIPKEHRTRDTYGTVWNNNWNPYGEHYNWYDWFVNSFVGGRTHSVKSFPTFYTLESRKPLGADLPIGGHYSQPTEKDGVVVSYVANPTWETGHGAGGMKVMSGDYGLNARPGRTGTWTDPHIGLTITVIESTPFYDKVEVSYTGKATTGARHVYQGLLKASDNHVTAAEEFTVDFDILTLGTPAIDDYGLVTERTLRSGNMPGVGVTTTDPVSPLPVEVKRVATPLGVPGGLAGFTMRVEFDPARFDYVSADKGPFAYTVDNSAVAAGVLTVTAAPGKMIDKQTVLSLNFRAKADAPAGEYAIRGTVTDAVLLNWRGGVLRKGDPGFDDVGTFGDGTLAALYNTAADNTYTPGINSTGGWVTVGDAATYTVSGRITCDTPGPGGKGGEWIGVESAVTLYDNTGAAIASARSDWDGDFTIKGIPAGTGYRIAAEKPKYDRGTGAAFDVTGDVRIAELTLGRTRYPVSGTIYGAANSDGSGRVPLAGVEVYVLGIGNGYRVLGGPAITDAQGRYTVHATTDSEAKAFAGLAVRASGNAAKYGTQLRVFAKSDLTGKQTEDLNLNMGMQPHLISDDWVYPANNERLGAAGTFAFNLGGPDSRVVTGRDITLTETQDVHIRTVTKSTDIHYQLRRWPGGETVGGKVRSMGTGNGDDLIRNVPRGRYYIEVTRAGYVTVNTMPFTVFTTRLLLRDGQTSNTLDINTRSGTNVVSGKIVDGTTGLPIGGANVVFQSWSVTGGAGNPVKSAADGTFACDVPADDKQIVFSKDGYRTETIDIRQGGAAGMEIRLTPGI